MYTMIHQLNSEQVNLLTLEDPVEYNIDGINQVQINEKTGMTFAGGLRSILRQDPDTSPWARSGTGRGGDRHARGHHRPSGPVHRPHQVMPCPRWSG